MRICRFLITVCFLYTSFGSKAQTSYAVQEYINTYKDIAIAEMQRTGVPAAIKLAQGIIETDAGQSILVNKSNNHFGIKCKSNWTGESVSHDDDARGECFRKYHDAVESYRDHSNFLKSNQRYAFLFTLDPTDFEGWANGLKKAGYATNPKYPLLLIKVINENNLQDYSLIALGKKSPDKQLIYASASEPVHEVKKETVVVTPVEQAPPLKVAEPVAQKKYPSGEFTINDTKVIFAQKGTSFLALALNNNLPLSRIFEYNEMKEQETVPADQLIFLGRKKKTGASDFHVVSKGETLHAIAQVEGIRLQNLMEYNSLSENQIPAAGEKLFLKTKAPTAPKLAKAEELNQESNRETTKVQVVVNEKTEEPVLKENTVKSTYSNSNDELIHTVQNSETLFHISKLYNVGVREIYDWNKLSSYDLKEGQQLKILKKGTHVGNSKNSR